MRTLFLKMVFIFAGAMSRKLLIIILLVFPGIRAKGQDTLAYRWSVNAGMHTGFLVAHRPMIVPLQQRHITGFETNLVMNPGGSKLWHRVYGFPEMGLSFLIWDLGNEEQLGTAYSLIPYLNFPLTKGKKTQLNLKFGWGVGYIEKRFNADNNHKNIAIGSHLNYALILQPQIKTRITDRLHLNGGFSIAHFSNGSVATPNLGINVASITTGLSYNFGQPVIRKTDPLPPFIKSNRFSMFAAISMKQVYPADGKNYFACTVSGNQSWQISRKSAFGFGTDIFYDNSISQKLEERNRELNNSLEALRIGIHGGYEMVISDFSLVLNFGGYLYSKLQNDGTFYQRIGLRYRLSEIIFVAMHLKAHWGKAD